MKVGDLVKVKDLSPCWEPWYGIIIDDTYRHLVTVHWFDKDWGQNTQLCVGVQEQQRVHLEVVCEGW